MSKRTYTPRRPSELIIERPDWQTRRDRVVNASIAALGWSLWGYLWLPLLTGVGWLGEFGLIWRHMIVLQGYNSLWILLSTYGSAIAVLGCLFIGWAFYNYFRFRGLDRRRPRPPITPAALATFHQLKEADVIEYWTMKRLEVRHDQHGAIVEVRHLE